MKKIYLKPEIENTIINMGWLMTPNGGGTTGDVEQQTNPAFPFTPAPKRRVF